MLRSFWTSILVLATLSSALRAQEVKLPNLLIDVSARLINAAVERSVDSTDAVNEVILETPVHGIGRTRGTVSAALIPDAVAGLIDVVFRGQVDSETVGTRPHTLVHTITATPLEIRRRVSFDSFGIRTYPSAHFGYASTHLLAVTGRNGDPLAAGTDMVARGFRRTKAEGEAESATKAAWRVSERINDELTPALSSVWQSARFGLDRLKQGGMVLESLQFNTDGVFVQARLRLASPNAMPPKSIPALPADCDNGLRVHQSLLNEAARQAYGGRSFTVNKVSSFYDEVTMKLLRDARKEREKEDALKILEKVIAELAGKPATINLAMQDPLTIAFIENGFTIDAHIASIRFGPDVYSGGRVQAKYQFENNPDGVHLVRREPVKLVLNEKPAPGEKKFAAAPEAFKHLQELLFSEILKERLIVNELPLPEALTKVGLSGPRVAARDGWIILTWNVKSRRN